MIMDIALSSTFGMRGEDCDRRPDVAVNIIRSASLKNFWNGSKKECFMQQFYGWMNV